MILLYHNLVTTISRVADQVFGQSKLVKRQVFEHFLSLIHKLSLAIDRDTVVLITDYLVAYSAEHGDQKEHLLPIFIELLDVPEACNGFDPLTVTSLRRFPDLFLDPGIKCPALHKLYSRCSGVDPDRVLSDLDVFNKSGFGGRFESMYIIARASKFADNVMLPICCELVKKCEKNSQFLLYKVSPARLPIQLLRHSIHWICRTAPSHPMRESLIDAYVNVFCILFDPPSARTEIDAWIQGDMVLTPDQIGSLFSNDFNLSQKNSDSYIVYRRTQIMETASEDTRIILIQKFYESVLPEMSRNDPFCHQIINEIRVQLTAWENFSPDGITGAQLVLASINPPKDPPYRDVGARFRIALVLADDVTTRNVLRCIFSHLFPDMQSLSDPIDGVNAALNAEKSLEYRMLKALEALSRIESVSDVERTTLEQVIGNAPYLGYMNVQRLLRWVPTPPSIDGCRELLAVPVSDSYLLSLGRIESMCRTPWGANSWAAFEMINDYMTEWLGGHPGDDGVVLRVMSSIFQLLDSETLWCSIVNFSPVTDPDSHVHGDVRLTGQLQALGTHQKMRNRPIDPGRMDELVDSQERLILVSEWTNAQKVNVLTHLYSLSPSRMNLPQVMSTGRGDKIRRQGGRSELLLKAALLAQRMAAPWLVPLIAPRSQIRSFQSLYSTVPDGATQLYSDIETLQTFTDFRHTDLGSAISLLAGITPNVGLRIILGGVSIPGYIVGKMPALRALIQSELARKIPEIEIRSLEGRRRIILTRVIQFLAFPQDAVAQFVHLGGGLSTWHGH